VLLLRFDRGFLFWGNCVHGFGSDARFTSGGVPNLERMGRLVLLDGRQEWGVSPLGRRFGCLALFFDEEPS